MTENESSLQESQALVNDMNRYSRDVTEGKLESSIDLLNLVLPPRPDDDPKYDADKLSSSLSPTEKYAVSILQEFGRRFDTNFGFSTEAGEMITWDNDHVRRFFHGLGSSVNGILNPDYEHGSEFIVNNLIRTEEAFRDLLMWSQNEFHA